MAEVLTKKGSPEVSAIVVTDPVQITAYGLGDGDCVTFFKKSNMMQTAKRLRERVVALFHHLS